MSSTCSEIVWLRGLFGELGFAQHEGTLLIMLTILVLSNFLPISCFMDVARKIKVDCPYDVFTKKPLFSGWH